MLKFITASLIQGFSFNRKRHKKWLLPCCFLFAGACTNFAPSTAYYQAGTQNKLEDEKQIFNTLNANGYTLINGNRNPKLFVSKTNAVSVYHNRPDNRWRFYIANPEKDYEISQALSNSLGMHVDEASSGSRCKAVGVDRIDIDLLSSLRSGSDKVRLKKDAKRYLQQTGYIAPFGARGNLLMIGDIGDECRFMNHVRLHQAGGHLYVYFKVFSEPETAGEVRGEYYRDRDAFIAYMRNRNRNANITTF